MNANLNKRWIKSAVAVAVAITVNVLLFVAIALVNRVDPVAPRTLPPEKLAILQLRLETPPATPKPEPPEPEQKVPTVEINLDLPMPEPQPMELPPMPLKLLPPSLPTPSAIVLQPVPAAPAPPTPPASPPPAPAPPSPSGPPQASSIDQPPRGVSVRDPRYPQMALRRGDEGTVTVEVLIDEQGRVASVQIVSSVGSDVFVDAVRTTASGWRFTPPRHRGKPVKVLATKTVHFRIEDQ